MNNIKEGNKSLEAEIFNGLVGFGIVVVGLDSVQDFIFVSNLTFKIFDIAILSLMVLAYFVSKKYGMHKKLIIPVAIGLLLTLSGFFFFLGGFRGSVLYFYILLVFSYSILLKPRLRNIVLFFNAFLIIFLIGFQISHPEYFINVYNNDFNILLSFFLCFSFIAYGAIIVRAHYDKANSTIINNNDELFQKNLEINKKNEELLHKSSEIEVINNKLNEKVLERTRRIKAQNKKLIEYAFFNSHKVRGPVARIRGLVELLKTTSCEEEKKLYIEKLEETALELDEIVGEINKILVEG
jgi:signal transduction histidine kinase